MGKLLKSISVGLSLFCCVVVANAQWSMDTLKKRYFSEAEISYGRNTFERNDFALAFIPSLELNKNLSVGLGFKLNYTADKWDVLYMEDYLNASVEFRGYSYLRKQGNTPLLRTIVGANLIGNLTVPQVKPLYGSVGIGQLWRGNKKSVLAIASYEYGVARHTYFLSPRRTIAYSDWYRNHSLNIAIALRF